MRLWSRPAQKKLSFEELMTLETAEAEAALDPLEAAKRLAFKRTGVNWWPEGKEPAYIKRARQNLHLKEDRV